MDNRVSPASEIDRRLDEVATAYLKAQEAGQTPDRQALLDRHPDLAAELREFFADQERFDRLAAPLRPLAVLSGLASGATPRPVATVSEMAPFLPPSPRSFGDYTVLGPLGQGGMGVVWKARQRRPDRLVALKMFRASDLASPTDVQRFRNEAEVIGQLDHAHIVPVYEVGEHDGVQYFSMKLVEGGSLAEHLDRFRADPRAAAQLLVTVARAVHYAHQRGILHRDLKPSNVLLDADGRPHVSDFGLAKRLEADSSLTQSGAIIGTPSYMTPEQAAGVRGAITTATDVYGLGALLYTLLCARPPFKGETVLGTLEQVKTREPDPPSGSNPKLDRDLETICLKCLEKEPGRRYGSAEAVADELERWLRGEPILARSPSRIGQLWRWCRRNRVVAGLAATVAVVVILAIVGLSVATAVIRREHEETKTALAEARDNYAVAEVNRSRAEVNSRDANWALEDILCAFDPERSSRPVSVAELRQWQTERTLSFLAASREDQGDDPSVRGQKAGAYVHTGRVYQVLGERDKAHKAFQQALAVYVRLFQDFPDGSRYDQELATALRIMAEDRYEVGRLADANVYYRQAVGAWRAAIRNERTDPEPCLQLANLLCNWFDPQFRDPMAALELAQRGVELAPDDPHSWLALGFAYYRTGRWDAALEALQKSMQWPEVPRKWTWTHTLFFVAMTQWRLGRHEEAMQAYKQADRRMESSFRARDVLDRAIRAEAAGLLGIEPPAPNTKEEASRKD